MLDILLRYNLPAGTPMKTILVAIVLAFSIPASADTLKDREETLQLSKAAMERFINSDYAGGIELLSAYWPLPMVELEGLLNQINTQWPIVEQRFGEATGWEFVKEEYIGDSFVRYYFLHKFQHHAIYWRLSYYKPRDAWVVNGITYVDSLDPLYEVAD